MSANPFEAIQQMSRFTHNAAEWIKKGRAYFVDPAGDVTFRYYDETGAFKELRVPNRAKLVQEFIASVNNAMRKTFYVDATNGDDNNDGSENTPFKTLKKAIDSIPVGGKGIIRLKAGQTFVVDKDITIENKIINVEVYDKTDDKQRAKILVKSYINYLGLNASHQIVVNGCSVYKSKDVDYKNEGVIDPDKGTWQHSSIFYSSEGLGVITIISSNITLKGNQFYDFADSDGWWSILALNLTNCKINTNGGFVYRISGKGIGFYLEYNTSIDKTENRVTGLVKDANAVPRNIVSNIVF